MLRHFLIYLTLSIFVVLFAKYAHLAVVYIDVLFTYINVKLAPIFNQTGWGLVIRKVLVLVLLPLFIASIPAFIYRLMKREEMPHFIAITWVIWTIVVLSNILIR